MVVAQNSIALAQQAREYRPNREEISMARARAAAPPEAPESDPAAANGDEAAPAPVEATATAGAPEGAPLIHAAMVAILEELPAIGKGSRNEQQGFNFRSHDDVLNAVNPLMAKHGVYVVPHVLERVTDKRTTRSGSVMYEVNLHVQYRFIARDGSWIDASTWGEGTDSGDKATNKAMTMAFKNALAQAFAVSVEKNPDADRETPEETVSAAALAAQQAQEAQRQAPRSDRLRAGIERLASELDEQTKQEAGSWLVGVKEAALRDFGVATFEALREAELEEIGKALKAIKDGGATEPPAKLEFIVPF